MGTPTEPKPAKFFVALLAANALLAEVERDLVAILDVIDDRSEIVPWTVPSFIKEIGRGVRRFGSFSLLVAPKRLTAMKLQTQQIEDRYRRPVAGGWGVNLDPGYLDAFKVVLASTKNASISVRAYEDCYCYCRLSGAKIRR